MASVVGEISSILSIIDEFRSSIERFHGNKNRCHALCQRCLIFESPIKKLRDTNYDSADAAVTSVAHVLRECRTFVEKYGSKRWTRCVSNFAFRRRSVNLSKN
jgi:hypothetical protein